MKNFGLIDGVIQEPLGGAHAEPEEMAKTLKKYIETTLSELKGVDADQRIAQRIEKFSGMGFYEIAE